MEDFERIQYREHKRQELLEELKRMVWNRLNEEVIVDERANENSFYWGLITSITAYVHGSCPQELTNVFFSAAIDLFSYTIVVAVQKFTPVQAERELVMVELLKYVVEEMSRPVHQKMLSLSVPPGRDKFLKDTGLDKLKK